MLRKAEMAAKSAQVKNPEYVTLPQAAELAGVHYRTARRWVATGRLKAVRIGPKLLKISKSDLQEFLGGAEL